MIFEFMRAHQMIPVSTFIMTNVAVLMFLGMTLFLIYCIYQIIKSEDNGKSFRDKLNVGDKAYFSTQMPIECEVIDTDVKGDDQFVAVKVIVYKKSLYPKVDKTET